MPAQAQIVKSLGNEWGGRVAKRRQQLGFSQAQLAGLCSVTQQTISRIEAGGMIPMDRLKVVIAQRLGTTPSKLFAWPPMDELVGKAS